MVPLERRILALKMLLALPQSTSKAKPYSEWPTPPEVHIETDEANIYYQNFFKETKKQILTDVEKKCEIEEIK